MASCRHDPAYASPNNNEAKNNLSADCTVIAKIMQYRVRLCRGSVRDRVTEMPSPQPRSIARGMLRSVLFVELSLSAAFLVVKAKTSINMSIWFV